IEETSRRRAMQQEYNQQHGITPESIRKNIKSGIETAAAAHAQAAAAAGAGSEDEYVTHEYLAELQTEMLAAADSLDFERAASLRDRIEQLRQSIGKRRAEVATRSLSPGNGRRSRRGSGARV